MDAWLNETAGAVGDENLALALALLAAVAHAIFGALNKGGADPYMNRAALNIGYALLSLPFALLVLPWPTAALWRVLGVSYLVHIAYEWLLAEAYRNGDFTLVYPISRGVGPMLTAVFAGVVFRESLAPLQWIGLIALTGAIFGLAAANLRRLSALRATVTVAIVMALGAGVFTAAYTIVDAYGVRLSDNPFTYILWMFLLGGAGFPIVALLRHARLGLPAPEFRPLLVRGLGGGALAFASFGSAMLAMRIGVVAEVAAVRETSIVFAALIGVFVFHEQLNLTRAALIGLIALAAVIVQLG